MAFEKFERKETRGSKYITNCFATIPKDQSKIVFNRRASELLIDKKVAYIEIYYDTETGDIGFKGFSKSVNGSYKLCNVDGSSKTIHSKQFLKVKGIKGPARMNVKYDESLDMFIAYANKNEVAK